MRKFTGAEFDEMVAFFDGMAQTNWLGSVHDQLKEMTGCWDKQHVLDVGCGSGRFLLRGAHEAMHVTGIDLSEGMIEKSKDIYEEHVLSHKSTFLVGDACALPFKDDTFDLAISTCVLFLLPEPELGLKEMIRVVKHGGRLALLNPSHQMSEERAKTFCKTHLLSDFEEKTFLQWSKVATRRHRYSKEQLTAFFHQFAFENIHHEPILDELGLLTVATIKK